MQYTHIALLAAVMVVPAFGAPTWTYDGDVHPEADSPVWQAFGSNSFATLGNDGNDYLQIDTSPNGPGNSRYYQINSGADWNIDTAAGATFEWNLALDPAVQTNPSAAVVVFGDTDTPYAIARVYNGTGTAPGSPLGYRVVGLQTSSGDPEATVNLRPSSGYHTYRVDVQGSTASLYVDNYPWALATRNWTGGVGGVQEIRWGDQTGPDSGKYRVNYVRSYQSAVEAAPAMPVATATSHQRFLAHYDGDTANGGLNADYAAGNAAPQTAGGLISNTAKFGAGSLDQSPASGTVSYETANNFNVDRGTVEMWVQTSNWADGSFAGFFGATRPTPSEGDIRIQKTSGNALQVFMAGPSYATIWSLTSAPLSLDTDWHHLAWTWDLDANRSAIYVDGQVVDNSIDLSGLAAIDFLGTLNETFEVGTIQNGSAPFQGLIDEFRISDVDLYGGVNFTPQNAPYEIPEPSSLALLALGGVMLRRRGK